MGFDPDKYLAIKSKIKFKNPSVQGEYADINEDLKKVLLGAPAALTVTSGARTPEVNAAVGGVNGSKHLGGNAVDLRKDNASAETQKYLAAQGLKVLDEGDHLHVEGQPSAFDPDAYLAKKSSSPLSDAAKAQINKAMDVGNPFKRDSLLDVSLEELQKPVPAPEEKRSYSLFGMDIDNPLMSAAMGASDAYSAGLIRRSATGLRAIKDQLMGAEGTHSAFKDESLGDTYNRLIAEANQMRSDIRKDNPYSNAAGTIAGTISPSSLFGKAMKLGGAATKAVGLSKVAPLAAKLAQGAIGSNLYGQLATDFDATGDERMTRAAFDTAASGVGDLLSSGIGAGVKAFPGIRAKLFNSALGVPTKAIQQGENLGKDLVEMGGMAGTAKSLYKKATEGLGKEEEALQGILSNAQGPIDRDIVETELKNLVSKFKGQPLGDADAEVADKLVSEWINKYANVQSASDANTLKRQIYQMLGDRPYIAENLPAKKDALKAMARGLKKSVEGVAPEVKSINKNLSVYGKMEDLLGKKLAQGEAGKVSLTDTINNPVAGALGYVAGGATGIPAAIAGRSLAKSTLGKTATAQVLKYLEMLAQQGAKKGMHRALSPLASKAARELLGQGTQ